ncbi:MAG: hypothetical protein SFY80_16670 [Verrucomicrobiota bacterium]|nr:hypothetical protein [Verrucomicrobiota bacterium]
MDSPSASCYRLVSARNPFPGPALIDRAMPFLEVPQWPARWLTPPEPLTKPWVGQFRLVLEVPEETVHRFALTADERYELWLDGQRIDRGPDRGDRLHWYYASYEMRLTPGSHTLMVLVFAWGDAAPTAQISVRPGMLLAGDGDASHAALSTGVAAWEWRLLPAWDFSLRNPVGPQELMDCALLPIGWESGLGSGWSVPTNGRHGNKGFEMYPGNEVHLLAPSLLPAQATSPVCKPRPVAVDASGLKDRWLESAGAHPQLPAWQAMIAGAETLTLPPYSQGRVLLDLGAYACGRLQFRQRGGAGAQLQALWSEAAFFGPKPVLIQHHDDEIYRLKGDRAAWKGGFFLGFVDSWRCDGDTRDLSTLWWRAGRFIEIAYTVGEEPLVMETLTVEPTGYPFAAVAPRTGDLRRDRLMENCLRVLHTCAHETTMDCPHYEQLAYAGDSRIQFLCWLALCPGDTALMRHTLRHFQASALNPGLWTASSAPSRGCQVIPTFALWWIAIAGDFLAHTGDIDFLRPMLPSLRAMVERWLALVDEPLGICRSPAGWNFVDWAYVGGIPSGSLPGEYSGVLNWILLHGIASMADLERAAGEPQFAERYEARGRRLTESLVSQTWDPVRGCFRDAPGGLAYSEHAQALAWLTPWLPETQRAALRTWFRGPGIETTDVLRCQSFMAYYLFRAAREAGVESLIERRLEQWLETVDQGFTTTPETFGLTRSDAHAWSAHPLLLWLKPALPN